MMRRARPVLPIRMPHPAARMGQRRRRERLSAPGRLAASLLVPFHRNGRRKLLAPDQLFRQRGLELSAVTSELPRVAQDTALLLTRGQEPRVRAMNERDVLGDVLQRLFGSICQGGQPKGLVQMWISVELA